MAEKQKPGSFKPKHSELVLEKFFDDYITVWYREKIVSANLYDKARKEIDLLKNKKSSKEKKKRVETTYEDLAAVKDLQSNVQKKDDAAAGGHKSSRRKDAPSCTEEQRRTMVGNHAKVEDRYKQDLLSLRQQNEELLVKIHHLKEKISEIRADAHYELKEKDHQIEKMKKQLEMSRGQNEDLSKRLSKLAGDSLRRGNPDLADLSDRYRPTEIGKMFSEVYDNEWSDAFENISKMEDDKKVGTLHGIVTKAFKFCDDKFNEQTETVRTTLLGLPQGVDEGEGYCRESRDTKEGKTRILNSNIQNVLKDVRKEVAIETAGNVANEFNTILKQYVAAVKITPNKSMFKFAFKCVELCWLMVICDPPMALSEDKTGKPYDTGIYKPYTKSLRDLKTPVVALPVWPALRLHLNGPLVAKGVAQPGEGNPPK